MHIKYDNENRANVYSVAGKHLVETKFSKALCESIMRSFSELESDKEGYACYGNDNEKYYIEVVQEKKPKKAEVTKDE